LYNTTVDKVNYKIKCILLQKNSTSIIWLCDNAITIKIKEGYYYIMLYDNKIDNTNNQVLIYQNADETIRIDVVMQDETVWLSQKQIALLFGKDRTVITKHIKNIFNDNELDEKSTVQFLHIANSDKPVAFYNLDMIISVGYRVNSKQGTQFRIWATSRLKEYLIKGFVLDIEKLKSGKQANYFDELQAQIRAIRISERLLYQKIKDIYKLSIDYDPASEATKLFFAQVQNRLLFAISEQTAAEIVYRRANHNQANMGVTLLYQQRISKKDIVIAKNYLNKDEIKSLELLVEQYLAFAESMAMKNKPIYSQDWINKLDDILRMNEREILTHAGKISKAQAEQKALQEYDLYRQELLKIERENSLLELEEDLKSIGKNL